MSKAQRAQFTCAKVVMDSAQDIIGRFYAEITNLGISDTSRLFNQATCSNVFKHINSILRAYND
jgi:hypothetical protein